MKRWLSVLLVALLLGTLVTPVHAAQRQSPPPAPFWDVIGTEYQDAVSYLYATGLVSGTGEGTFSPRQQVTRAQMAAFVVRALGKQSGPVPPGFTFTDVPVGHWAKVVIAQAASLGVVKGTTDTAFSPDAPVTYAQAVTMLLRALGYEKILVGEFPVPQVLKAKELGWLEGLPFEVNAPATRGDVARMLAAAVFVTPHAETGLTLSQSVHRKPVSLVVGPEQTYITTGQTQLQALGVDWFGKVFPVDGAQWSGKGTGFTISANGALNVTTADRVTVAYAHGELFAERTYDVIKSIAITGANAGVQTGDKVTLKVEGTTVTGRIVNVKPKWTVVSGPGSITPDGTLSASGGGTIVVEAVAGSLRAEATLTSAASLVVTPATAVLAVGQNQKFSAKALDGNGKEISLPVTWAITQGSGTITPDGVLNAGSSGPIKVQASLGGLKATATIQLINRLTVTPNPASVAKGGTQQFAVTGHALDGSTVNIEPKWSATGGVGIMGTNGLLVGTNPGSGTVVAEYYGVRASVPLTVSGEATAIKLESSRASLPANGRSTATLTATVVDSRGNPARGTIESVTFGISSANLGTLSAYTVKVEDGKATVTFTPGEQAGQLIVIASAPGTQLISGSTIINTVVPQVARIKLEAYPSTIAADLVSRTQITATLEDSEGAPIKNQTGGPIHITLSTNASASGVLETNSLAIQAAQTSGTAFLRASNTVGSTTVTGVTPLYSVTPVQIQSVIVGPATKLAIRPNVQDTRADGAQLMEVSVSIQDASGYVRTGDNGTVIQLAAMNGTTTVGTYSASTVGGVATFRITSSVAGTYTLKATTYNSNIAAAEAGANFIPGPATRIRLAAEPATEVAADGVSVVVLKARIVDMYDNTVTSAANEVTFAKTTNNGATSMVNSTTVRPVNGVATLEVRSTAIPATDTFMASSQGLTSSSALSITSRITGGAYKVKVQVPSATTVIAGQSITVKVHVLDSLDQLVTGATGRTVSLLTTSATAVVNGPQSVVGGVATFTVTETKTGTMTLTAVSDGLQSDTAGRTVTVTAGPVTTVKLVSSTEGLAADGLSATMISAKALDSYGNEVNWSTAVQLSIDNASSGRLGGNYLYSGAQVPLYSTTFPGTITISGTGSGVTVTPLTLRTYVPAAPAKVVVEEVLPGRVSDAYVTPITFRVRILDVNGNLATGTNTGGIVSAIGITVSGSAGTNSTRITAGSNSGLLNFTPNGISTGSSYILNGVATFQFTNTKAETVLITPVAYYNGQPLQAVGARITTQPDVASQIAVSPSNLILTAQAPMPLTVMAAVADRFGNPVNVADDTLTFTPNNTNYLTFPETLSVNTSNGSASINITSKVSSGGATELTVRSAKTGLTSRVTITTDLPPARPVIRASNVADTSAVINAAVDTAVKITVTATPRASDQTVLVYVNGSLKAVYNDATGTYAAGPLSANQLTWVGYVKTTDFRGGNNTITVILSSSLGLSPVSDSFTVTVQ